MTSEIKVNNIKKASGSTITIGESGDTISLASGASQSGFGRSGTVDWQTSIKTSTFTASNGEGYFVNTSGGAVTVNLPAGTTGAIVSIKDYAQTFDTNNCTISADGSEKIENLTTDLILDTEGIAVTLIYADATRGWQAVNSNEVTNVQKFVTATGGTVTTSGNFKIHTFTGPGTFCVSCAGNAGGSNTVDYLVVAGGGSAGGDAGGGGGAGGTRFSDGTASGCYTAGPSPLSASALPVSAQAYPITVGGGGNATPCGAAPNSNPANVGNPGNNSVFSTITSAGGGGGGGHNTPAGGLSGGSGGGARSSPPSSVGGSGNTPPVSPPQGNDGGSNFPQPNPGGGGGGGGGAVCAGQSNQILPGPGNRCSGGNGGAGITSCITASPVGYGGGGGGGSAGAPGAQGGTGTQGGGSGSNHPGTPGNGCGTAGSANTGGGGGGGSDNVRGRNGGSGIVVIRYKFQ